MKNPLVSACWFAIIASASAAVSPAQQKGQGQPPGAQLSNRISISAGMGVDYLNAQDIVDRVNSTVALNQRVPDFKAAVEFFGNVTVPLANDWALKVEYAYLLGSYNAATVFGLPGEFGFSAHMPSLVLCYVLADGGVFDLLVGVGGGYHFGFYTEKYATVDDTYSGGGLGTILDLEAHTAFGDHLFGYLGAGLRWEFIGKLTSNAGKAPGGVASTATTTLHFFAAGVRLGLSYFF